jgi:hypothetical protein
MLPEDVITEERDGEMMKYSEQVRICSHIDSGLKVHTAFIFKTMIEAVRTSETSVYFNEIAWRYITDGYLHTDYRENLKSHIAMACFKLLS